MSEKSLILEKEYNCKPEDLYASLTKEVFMTRWLGNRVDAQVMPNGSFYTHWDEGYTVTGKFLELEDNKKVLLEWKGTEEPNATKVEFLIDAGKLTLTHSGIVDEDDYKNLQMGWEQALNRLEWSFKKGVDERVFGRPFMGILLGTELTEKDAERLGVPVTKGVSITGTSPDTGAAASGLQEGDVITKFANSEITSFASFGPAVAPYKPGDVVDLVVYRKEEKLTIPVELSKRPLPNAPETKAELVKALEAEYEKVEAEIAEIFEGATEDTARKKQAENEWSALETMAHLIYTERWLHFQISNVMEGQIPPAFVNDDAQLKAFADSYESIQAMLDSFNQDMKITLLTVKNLPDDISETKYKYVGLGNGLVEGFPEHTRSHYGQMREAIKAAKS